MKKNFRFLTFILISLLGLTSAHAYDVVDLWESYFPDVDCSENECARNVPYEAMAHTLDAAYSLRLDRLRAKKWLMVVDMTQHSAKKRGYLISMPKGEVMEMVVTHGVGSAGSGGYAVKFSNINNSKMTSLGLYETSSTYYGNNGLSLNLHGLENSNDLAYKRRIVIHGAKYARQEFINQNGRAGHSWGCPAIDDRMASDLIAKLKGGALYYIYGEE